MNLVHKSTSFVFPTAPIDAQEFLSTREKTIYLKQSSTF